MKPPRGGGVHELEPHCLTPSVKLVNLTFKISQLETNQTRNINVHKPKVHQSDTKYKRS